jgi:hypothetical protein
MPGRIADFLTVAKPNAYCERCIATALGVDLQFVIEATAGRGRAEGFVRRIAKCTLCGGVKRVIAAQ